MKIRRNKWKSPKKTKTLVAGLCCVVIVLLVVLIFSFLQKGAPNVEKVLVLGIDGFDPNIMQELMLAGELPHFSSLYFSNLTTVITPQSPIAWASISTGVNPGKHNIFDFIRRDPLSYTPLLSLSESVAGLGGTQYQPYLRGVPFWKITSQANIPTSIIRWPLTFPTEKISGQSLAGLGVPDVKGLLSSYTLYTSVPSGSLEKTILVLPKQTDDTITIATHIVGPRKKTLSGVKEITEPLDITIVDADSVFLRVSGDEYVVGADGWTDWMTIKFKTGFAQTTWGLTRAKIISTQPFQMYLVSVQLHPEKPMHAFSYPDSFAQQLAQEIHSLYYTLGIPEDTSAYEEDAISKEIFLEQLEHIHTERTAMFWYAFEQWQTTGGLLGFVFDDSDRVQHMFWDEEKISDEIKSYYVKKDALLGEILDRLDADDKLMIISDHGFTSFTTSVELNAWLIQEGYLVLTRTPLAHEETSLFKLVDWSKTKAYSVGFSGIYINLEGREGQGVVPLDEKDALVNKLVLQLSSFVDPATNKSVIKNVYRSEDIYVGPFVSASPDIIVGFHAGYRAGWQSPIGGTPRSVLIPNERKWCADHIVDPSIVPGVLFTNFPLGKDSPSVYDVAPTILDLFNITSDDMDGESFFKT